MFKHTLALVGLTLLLSVLPTLISCGGGGGGGDSTVPSDPSGPIDEVEITEPPVDVPEVLVRGFWDKGLSGTQYSFLVGSSGSYIFTNANDELPPEELLCESASTFTDFEINTSQQINLNCTGYGAGNAVLSLEYDKGSKEFNVSMTHDSDHNFTLVLSEIIGVSSRLYNEGYRQLVSDRRDDIDISRYVLGSVLSNSLNTDDEFDNSQLSIYSRDWPTGGTCLASKVFLISSGYDSLWNDGSDHTIAIFDFYYDSISVADPLACDGKVLAMPSEIEPLSAIFYLLEDESAIVIMTQSDFSSAIRLVPSVSE